MKDRMLRGEVYVADDPELSEDHLRASTLLEPYNRTRIEEQEERDRFRRGIAACRAADPANCGR